jgi:hypothetical protein
VYRFERGNLISANNPANIVAIVPRQSSAIQSWEDRTAAKRTMYSYGITAVDRTHNESPLSEVMAIRTRGKKGAIRIISPRP